jgi:hypothetical protein
MNWERYADAIHDAYFPPGRPKLPWHRTRSGRLALALGIAFGIAAWALTTA